MAGRRFMLLIDAHNIIDGGGKILLDYFISVLEHNQRNYFVIKNADVVLEGDVNNQINCKSTFERRKVLGESVRKINPDTILCFGNYPPQERFKAKTITYFQNSYLSSKWYSVFLNDKLVLFRQRYLDKYLKNTDYFLFQNNLIKDNFLRLYGKHSSITYLVIPFYNETRILASQNKELVKKDQFIYVSLPHKHKNHVYLLKVWEALQTLGHNPKLLLTIPKTKQFKRIIAAIDKVNMRGGNIINLGFLPLEDTLRHSGESKFCIYPSLLETLGLGLIESALVGCKVLATDLPYTKEVIEPSLYFDPYDISSGVNAVLKALEDEPLKETRPLIQNRIDELLAIVE